MEAIEAVVTVEKVIKVEAVVKVESLLKVKNSNSTSNRNSRSISNICNNDKRSHNSNICALRCEYDYIASYSVHTLTIYEKIHTIWSFCSL